ncbi:MAG: hypothetical protein WC898_03525 [Candidatus Paceibacterota bacterium]|jgi:hypothetical protein
MNDTPIDLLQIKIEKAKKELSDETLQSINAINWRDIILGMRQKRGYSFEQLETLELETELLLCGLLSTEDYPKELEARMGLQKVQVNDLLNELNETIFKKIREEFIKIEERKKIEEFKTPSVDIKDNKESIKVKESDFVTQSPKEVLQNLENKKELSSAINDKEIAEPKPISKEKEPLPIISQKFSSPTKTETKKTEYTFTNTKEKKDEIIQKTDKPTVADTSQKQVDPYREIPE